MVTAVMESTMRVGSREKLDGTCLLLSGTMRLGENSKMKQTRRRSSSDHRCISRRCKIHRFRRRNVLKMHVPVVPDELSEDLTLLLCVEIIKDLQA